MGHRRNVVRLDHVVRHVEVERVVAKQAPQRGAVPVRAWLSLLSSSSSSSLLLLVVVVKIVILVAVVIVVGVVVAGLQQQVPLAQ